MRLDEFEYQEVIARFAAKKQAKPIRSPQSQGYLDYWDCGVGKSKNPYPVDTKEAREWYSGWLEAHKDEEKASK